MTLATPDATTNPRTATPASTSTPADQIPNPEFGVIPDDATIQRTADALRAKGYAVYLADDAATARDLIVGLVPEGAEVSQGASQTLEDLGVSEIIEHSGRFDAVRPRTRAMDRSTPEGIRAMRKLGTAPDWYLNSAHALTEDGTIVVASNTGSQLGPLAFGAGEVVFAIGVQKIVPDLATAFRRIEEHTLPLENGRMQGLYGINSEIKKLLIINQEFRPSRFTIVLIREHIGF
jgi:hypothetical protein